MNWIPWVKVDRLGLARYVSPATGKTVRLETARSDLLQQANGRKLVCEAIYDALFAKRLRYSTEPYDADRRSQEIRSPAEILSGAGNGTCLDLAALFAGVCLDNDLLPILVVIHGHAFVLVSLHYSRHQANDRMRIDAAGGWTSKGILNGEHLADAEILKELLASEAWLPVECTGFAFSTQLANDLPEGQGRENGYMSFDRACAAGLEHAKNLSRRPFEFAIDVALVHDNGMCPYDYQAPWQVGYLWEVPSATEDYVNRTGLVDAIVKLLVAPGHGAPSPKHAVRPIALCGSAGIGKTTAAVATCGDKRVQHAFPDGVIWLTLGQEPSVLRLLNEKINTLAGGSQPFASRTQMLATSIAEGTRQLAERVATRRVLIVIDDVWQASHLLPFLVGSSTCRILVTSRDTDVAKAAKAQVVETSVMTPGEARELLLSKCRSGPGETDRHLLDQVAKVLGYLPLGLELASQRIEDGYPLEHLLNDLNREIARLDVMDRSNSETETDEATARNLSLNASVNLSLARLSKRLLEEFAWLGVVQGGSTISAQFAAKLWSTDLTSAQCDILALAAKSLLQRVKTPGETSLAFSMHDVMLAKARNLLFGDSQQSERDRVQCLGIAPSHAHAKLIQNYRAQLSGSAWHFLERDGYIEHHLFHHLRHAGYQQELFDLLGMEHRPRSSALSSNGWYWFREQAGEIDYFIDDVKTALDLSLGALNAEKDSTRRFELIGYAVQFCATLVSVNNQGSNITPDIAISLMKANVWTIQSAYTHGQKHFSAAGLAKLAMHAPYPLRGEILSTAIRTSERTGALGLRIRESVRMLNTLEADEASIVADRLLYLLQAGRPSVLRKIRDFFADESGGGIAFSRTEFDEFPGETTAMDDIHWYVAGYVFMLISHPGRAAPESTGSLDEIVRLICRFHSGRPVAMKPDESLNAQYKVLYNQLLYAALTIRKELAELLSPSELKRLKAWIQNRLDAQLFHVASCPVFVFRALQHANATDDAAVLDLVFRSLGSEAFEDTQSASRLDPLGSSLAKGMTDDLVNCLPKSSLIRAVSTALQFGNPVVSRSCISAIGRRLDEQARMQLIDNRLAGRDQSGAWILLRCWARDVPQDFLCLKLNSLLSAIDFRTTSTAALEDIVSNVCALIEDVCRFALDRLLAVLRHIPAQASKAMLLQSMLPCLPQGGVKLLLPIADEMSHFESKLVTYHAFAAALPYEDASPIIPKMIASAMKLETEPRSINTVVEVAYNMPPQVSVPLLSLALKISMGVHDRAEIAPVLATCIGGLSEPNRSFLLRQNPIYHGIGDYQGVERLEKSRFYELERSIGDICVLRRDLRRQTGSLNIARKKSLYASALSTVSRAEESSAKLMNATDHELIDSLAKVLRQDTERIRRTELYEQICQWVEEFNWRGLEVAGLTCSLGLRACVVWWP
jgi:hypothetical protein